MKSSQAQAKDKLAWISGAAGVGLLILGAGMYARERKLGLNGGLGRGGRFLPAPIVNTYSDGNMTTTLRSSRDMPIEQRIATIQEKIEKSIQDPEMHKIALQATRNCPERDGMCEAKAIYDFVKARVRYTGDIAPIKWRTGEVDGVDVYRTARRTLEFGGGDCDDQSILVASLLTLNGITAKLRVTAETKRGPESHIYPGALLPKFGRGKFVAVDTTLPGNQAFGIEAPYKRAVDFDA